VTRVWDSAAGRTLELSALLDRLAQADVVFLGETHLDDTTHRVEAAVLEGLLERRQGKVVLSLEMFERDVQPLLDDYLAGRIDEPTFLAGSRPWGNYRTAYRPLIEGARRAGIPALAANAPARLRRKLGSGGREALEQLGSEDRHLLPAEILPASPAYWARVDRATRGHMNVSSQTEEQRLFSGQNLWDNSMGAACAEALVANPGALVLHVVGGFHVMYHDGTAAQLRLRAPAARVAVVEILPTLGSWTARSDRDGPRADYLVYADALARGLQEGTHAVLVPTELRYTIDLPATASDERPAPLLVWLPGGDERPEDARAYLQAALGDEVALAVVEPPYPREAEDLGPGGLWSARDFSADQARVQAGLERLVEYVTRRFPVSGQRVLIAGNGLGATAVLWSALYTEWLEVRFLAVDPRGTGALRLEGLPDQAPATRELSLLASARDEDDLRALLADYASVGTPTALGVLATDVPLWRQTEEALRAALELAPRPQARGEPLLCVLERDLPRARMWAEVYARRQERAGRPTRIALADELSGRAGEDAPERLRRLQVGSAGQWPPAAFAEGRGLPLAPGAFGGTTVLVVPAGADARERAAWQALERDKALQKRSFFAGLRVALSGEEPSLATVLGELAETGARSVLVVPAVFCASADEMQSLRRDAGEARERLDLSWLPGLGAELCSSPED